MLPAFGEVHEILFVSTGPQIEFPLLKRFLLHGRTIVNPPWSLLVRRHAFGHTVSVGHLRDGYKKWGGIPTRLFHQARMSAAIESEVKERNQCAVFRFLSDLALKHAVEPVMSEHLFHLVPGQRAHSFADQDSFVEFTCAEYRWASRWMQGCVWDGFNRPPGELWIMNFISNSSNALAARGYAFDPHALHTLENVGIYGRIKHLTTDGQNAEMRPQQLGPLQRVGFGNIDELPSSVLENTTNFYVPDQTDQTVDFYVPSHGLVVQTTVAQKHGVKWTEVDLAIKSGMFDKWFAAHIPLDEPNNRPKLRVVFLCVQSCFENFSKQKWLNANGTKCLDTAAIEMQTEQYVWELDVELQMEIHRGFQREIRERGDLLRGCGNWGVNDLERRCPLAPIRNVFN